MGFTSRLVHMILSTIHSPFIPLRSSAVALRRSLSVLSASPLPYTLPRLPLSLRAAHQIPFRTRVALGEGHGVLSDRRLLWTEWSAFVQHITSVGYGESSPDFPAGDEDALEESLGVPQGFARIARACIAFAYDRPALLKSLPKYDIEVVARNVTPSLFKNRAELVQRMTAFLNSEGGNVFNYEMAQTVDLVRYLISYAHSHLFCYQGNENTATKHVDVSVCTLLNEIIKLSGPVEESSFTDSTNSRSLPSLQQSSSSPTTNMHLKGGDWICPKCDFVNFSRNMKCLECEEARPKKVLVGGEWECPQCDFFNFGRNMTCLRCDCARPVNSSRLDKTLGKTSDISSTGNSSSGQVSIGSRDQIAPRKQVPNYVPFVPLPADMFKTSSASNEDNIKVATSNSPTKKPSGIGFSESVKSVVGSPSYQERSDLSNRTSEQHDLGKSGNSSSNRDLPEIMPIRRGENRFVVSKKKDRSLTAPQYKRQMTVVQSNGSNFVPFVPFPPDYFARKNKQPEAGPTSSEADSSGSTDAASFGSSQNHFEGYPERMPSENHPLSNQQRGNAESSRWDLSADKIDAVSRRGANTSTSNQGSGQKNKAESLKGKFSGGNGSRKEDGSWNINENQGSDYRSLDATRSGMPSSSLSQNSIVDGRNTSPSSGSNTSLSNAVGSTAPRAEMNQAIGEGSRWKSLEGSAVSDPDPLDMSEDAKAKRWFRRVAQITDISELANIPDEDFPQIMPMRKGVNRFVVSKRKTPLERRLTSPQYRRNLPVVSSEPEIDSSNQDNI